MKMTTTTQLAALLIFLLAGPRGADAQTVTVALTGETAPGTSDIFSDFVSLFSSSYGSRVAPVLNDAGQTAFSGSLNSSSSAIDLGIWSEGRGSGLALVARSGSVAPGTSDTFYTFKSPTLNNAGQAAFSGSLNSSSSAIDLGIWSEGRGSGLALVAREGNVAPGTSDTFASFEKPVLNDAGQTAFRGVINSSTSSGGIWSEGGGSGLALVAREGNVAPGTSDTFSRFDSTVLNDAGQTAFRGRLNSSTSSSGIWSEGGGSGLSLVARQGNVAPGTSDTFFFFDPPVLNDAGQTAFFGFLSSVSNRGIWAEDQAGVLTLIAREGDLLDVDDGPGTDFRTIRKLVFWGDTGDGGGRRSSFNNLGQLVFTAGFTDGTSGVFVSNLVAIPEPSTLLLGAMASLGMLIRRRDQ